MFNPNDEETLPVAVSNAMVEIEKSRAVQEVQAALIIAKKFPRDMTRVFSKIMESCKRISLAEQSQYAYPRAGEVVTGPSIRLAEVLAQNYGNLDFGIRELERREGSSIAESYCWDMENNTKQTKIFEVPHEIYTKKGGMKKLTDHRDVYELVANNGARRLRACILGIIPGDITDAAIEQCNKTLAKGDGSTPLVDRIRNMVTAFKEFGVSQEMLEKRLGHKMELTTTEQIVELTRIYTSIRDKQAKRGDFFEFPGDEEPDAKSAELSDKLKAAAEKKKAESASVVKSAVKPKDEPKKAPELELSPEFEAALAETEDPAGKSRTAKIPLV